MTIVVGPEDSTRRLMVDEPASSPATRAASRHTPVRVFDSIGRWVAVIACLLAAVCALAGLPAATTAATAVLGAVGTVVARVKVRATVRPHRSATALADEILAASSVQEMEAVVRTEIASWPKFALSWCALAPVVALDDSWGLPDQGAEELQGVLLSVELTELRPQFFALAAGEAVAFVCGAESEFVLVVASSRWISDDAVAAFGEIAAIAGVAARQLDLDAEVTARRAAARFEELVHFSSDAIFIVDAAGIIRYAAPSVTAVLGRLSVDVDGIPLTELVVPEHAPDVASFLANVQLLEARNSTSIALRFTRADGSLIDGELTGANLLDNRDVRGIVVTVRDVSSRVELEDQLRHQAFHDGLTGLANRALFRDRLERSMRVRRDPTDRAPAVVYIDLDDFKSINDSFGHLYGDQALRCVAERIVGCLRGADTPARLGGDEFAILLEELPDDVVLLELVQRVLDTVAAPMTLGTDTVVTISASAGVATCSDDVSSADDLLRRADIAMYRAKVRGKKQVAHYESAMHQVVHDRLELAAELDAAIRAHELEVHYQPIVDLTSTHIVGIEAFVRWPNTSRGPLRPPDFLDVAENTGLAVPLGAEVIRRALTDIASWRDVGIDGFVLSVNVSARQFLHDDFETMVCEELAAHDIDPSRLILEITENVLTVGGGVAEERLRSLTALGIGVALDDFGTGQSSLQTLQSLPVGQLKIDRSFVAPLRDGEGSVLAQGIVDLALLLGASAVAEGIEHPDELAALRALGCGLGQGNLFGAPSPASDMFPMLVAAKLGPVSDQATPTPS